MSDVKLVKELPVGERFVAMTTCQGRVYVATERQVFIIVEDIARDEIRVMPIEMSFTEQR